MRARAFTAVAAAALVLAAGCSSGDDDGSGGPAAESSTAPAGSGGAADRGEPPPAKGSAKVVGTVAENLETPWGLAELPGGDLLVSSRDTGTVYHVAAEGGKVTEAGQVPGVQREPGNEGGLLGLALGADEMLYAYLTSDSDNRIVRMTYDSDGPEGNRLGAPDTVFRGIPKGGRHNGGRIAFGPDKMLYVGTGEAGDPALAQDKDSLGGKILRMTPDGEPARGNPEAGSVVYSYGHRNVQGLAWDDDKRLWAAEFGDQKWDELNLIEPGKNYGWPEVEGKENREGFVDPVVQWPTPDASPSGIAFADGSIWMASLRGERLWRIPLDGTKAAADPQAFFDGKYGRLRTVQRASDGDLLLMTNETDLRGTPEKGDDRILRLEVS
ncbi:PQQ-dependent sugar dehydrogenase [Streptomyces sp. NBC_01808]|uniref:PQQ-dependent sugar dehydrogenase n=1 Tax=Streptomyces sp. NBC_01808 TaxID=2975947 RepID=UPI002DD9DD71|nr:PQQ-dependent sugar dehydrogenase [Streptomyces sp. NBC_01808]WSA40849.1 PQQ-dependent sugar dehydrogenase [Streptomyces sp. NBC_01808]